VRVALAALVAACLIASAGCTTQAEDANAAADPARLRLPQQIVGLQVGAEKVGEDLKAVRRPYVDTVAVFSLREEDLLRASLQINRFNRAARPEDRSFREQIVSTIGGTAPLLLRVGKERVFATTASEQTVFVWFAEGGMFVLSVQKDFQFPRTLLRRFIELDLSL
jgi:hypothetical protein